MICLQTLLNDLYAIIDTSKLNEKSKLEVTANNLTYVLSLVEIRNNLLLWSMANTGSSAVQITFAEQSATLTDCHYGGYSATNNWVKTSSDTWSPSAGQKLIVIY